MSTPSSRIWPWVGCSKPAIMRSVVVLPQPEEPSSEKNSPAGMWRLIPSTAFTAPKRLTRLTSWTSPPLKRPTPPPRSSDVERPHIAHHLPRGTTAGGPLAASHEAVDQIGEAEGGDSEIDHDRGQRVDRGKRRRTGRAVDADRNGVAL